MKGGVSRARRAAQGKNTRDRSYLDQFRKSGKADKAKARNEQRRREVTEGSRRYRDAARAVNYATNRTGRGA